MCFIKGKNKIEGKYVYVKFNIVVWYTNSTQRGEVPVDSSFSWCSIPWHQVSTMFLHYLIPYRLFYYQMVWTQDHTG
jgi:hypothetical protein